MAHGIFLPPWYAIVICTSPPFLAIGAVVGYKVAGWKGVTRGPPMIAGALGGVIGAWLAYLPILFFCVLPGNPERYWDADLARTAPAQAVAKANEEAARRRINVNGGFVLASIVLGAFAGSWALSSIATRVEVTLRRTGNRFRC